MKEYDWKEKKERSIALYNNIDTIEGYSSFVIENAYENELKAFFEAIEKGTEPRYSFKKDLAVLDWIDRIEPCIRSFLFSRQRNFQSFPMDASLVNIALHDNNSSFSPDILLFFFNPA